MLQILVFITDVSKGIIHDHKIFIIQATGSHVCYQYLNLVLFSALLQISMAAYNSYLPFPA
jgi:hypothetical protein